MSREAPKRCPHCGGTALVQDEDVLDTWFSAWLWPFSTLGWPERTPELSAYYPTDTLVTDRGIIYFWVARMVMAGLKFMGEVPFADVYIHGTILDEQGRKMSKSLGNGIDPIDIIETYGADAMRFSLVVLSTEGQDLKLSESKFEMGRNFCNKLWNAARFAMMNLEDFSGTAPADADLSLADRWILFRLQETTHTVAEEMEQFHFSVAAQTLYHFVWNEFCDWYVEAAKLALNDNGSATARSAAQHTLHGVLSEILKLLHPFLPFITEEIWGTLNPKGRPLIVTPFPKEGKRRFVHDQALFENAVKAPVEAIRNIRGEGNVPPGKRIPESYLVSDHDGFVDAARRAGCARYVEFLARVDRHAYVGAAEAPPETQQAATAVTAQGTLFIPMAGLIDVAAETARLTKEIGRAENEIAAIEKKLANRAFVDGAPAAIVERERGRLALAREKRGKLEEALAKVRRLA